MVGLSAVVITWNEERNIERCLQSLSFCDEIIVVDSESTDRTRELCQRYTPNFHILPWKGYTEQKNFSVSLTKNHWVLSLDADEEVPLELREEIRRRLADPGQFTAFSVPRKTIHFGRWIRYGGWYPDPQVRLFQKDRGRWVGGQIHERWQTDGALGDLSEPLLHYSFADLSDQVSRNNYYSTLGAKKLMEDGRRASGPRLILKSFSKFFETYFLKKGFLDGYPGLIIAVSAAYSVFLKWAKLWEMQREQES